MPLCHPRSPIVHYKILLSISKGQKSYHFCNIFINFRAVLCIVNNVTLIKMMNCFSQGVYYREKSGKTWKSQGKKLFLEKSGKTRGKCLRQGKVRESFYEFCRGTVVPQKFCAFGAIFFILYHIE